MLTFHTRYAFASAKPTPPTVAIVPPINMYDFKISIIIDLR